MKTSRHFRMGGAAKVRAHFGWRSVGAAGLCLAVLAGAGCSSRSAAQAAAGGHDTLVLGIDSGPLSLSPVKIANGSQQWLVDLAYLPLVDVSTDGALIPGIAKSWTIGKGNRSIDFTLDPAARFSDGTAVTASAVANSLNYFIKNSTGPQAGLFGSLKASAAPDGHVIVTSANPNPDLPLVFTPNYLGGDIISPAAIADPAMLSSGTYGAGPYMLDAGGTVANEQYTYVPNPHYGEGKAHFSKIVVKIIASTDSRLAALTSGQINVMIGSPETAAAATSAGLTVAEGMQAWNGFIIADRSGKVVPALKDVRVRQALNYAVNRAAISQAVIGKYGQPDEQSNSEGFQGYDASLNNTYTYDPAKAKQLLAAAGYPHGFTMTAIFLGNDPVENETMQAIAGELSSIGVKLQLKAEPNSGAFVQDINSRQYAAIGLSFGGQPQFANVPLYYLPNSPLNPFNVVSGSIIGAFGAYATASAADADTMADAVSSAVMAQAPAVSVLQSPQFIFASKWVKNVGVYAGGQTTNPRLWSAG